MPDWLLTFIGLIYGLILVFFGICFAGGGHGTYLFMMISAAPMSIFPPVAIVVAPLMWPILIPFAWKGKSKIFPIGMGFHLGSIIIVLPLLMAVSGQAPQIGLEVFLVAGHLAVCFLLANVWWSRKREAADHSEGSK